MASEQENAADEVMPRGKSPRDKAFRAVWTYLRGCVVILVLLLFGTAAKEGFTRVDAWLEPVSESMQSTLPSATLALAILIFGPWLIGKTLELLLAGKLLRKQRGFRAYRRMESRLATELRADHKRGYRVALVNWPNSDTRSLGLIVADLTEPETGRDLAAVFLPGTPDPTKGAIRVVLSEDLLLTDWDLSDLTRFHLTFGSASPELIDATGDAE